MDGDRGVFQVEVVRLLLLVVVVLLLLAFSFFCFFVYFYLLQGHVLGMIYRLRNSLQHVHVGRGCTKDNNNNDKSPPALPSVSWPQMVEDAALRMPNCIDRSNVHKRP